MLLLKARGENALVEAEFQKVVVRTPFAREDGPAVIDKSEDQRFGQSLIFGLDVIGDAAEFNICIKACDHGLSLSKGEGRMR
jgi:hypothetical protein